MPKTEEAAAAAAARQNARVPAAPARRPRHSSSLPEEESATGNVTATYINFGQQGKGNKNLERHLIRWLRQNPGFIIGGSEISQSYKDGLEADEVPALPPTVVGSTPAVAGSKDRSQTMEYKYIVEIMNCDKPCMVAVRARVAETLMTLYQNPYDHGLFKKKQTKRGQGPTWSPAISKVIICEVVLRSQPCILPKNLVVMVLHFHYVAAKGECGKTKRTEFLQEIVQLVRQYNVTMLMMDANMALLMVFETLRSSGVLVDLVAWWPWQLADGRKGMDSCCILLIGQPGKHKINHNLQALDAGTLWQNAQQLPGRVEEGHLKDHPGYGQLTKSYHTQQK